MLRIATPFDLLAEGLGSTDLVELSVASSSAAATRTSSSVGMVQDGSNL
jgi:hypothetical protein